MEGKSREREYGNHGQFWNIVTDPEEVREPGSNTLSPCMTKMASQRKKIESL